MADAERHFRQTHLPALLRETKELTVAGVTSRQLPDRGLGRVIESAWSTEIRSPSKMMQELASGLRQAGLNIFRHRRGMLFVSPIRIRTFGHDRTSVSVSINRILEQLTETAPQTRKQLAEKITPAGAEAAEIERVKMQVVSDLRWLISEGYVIEFNDGTLDMPRAKAPQPTGKPAAAAQAQQAETPATAEAAATEAEATQEMVDTLSAPADEDGGMQVEQSIEPVAAATEHVAEEPASTPEAALAEDSGEAAGDEPQDAAPQEQIPSPS
jgi:hypothetical protein